MRVVLVVLCVLGCDSGDKKPLPAKPPPTQPEPPPPEREKDPFPDEEPAYGPPAPAVGAHTAAEIPADFTVRFASGPVAADDGDRTFLELEPTGADAWTLTEFSMPPRGNKKPEGSWPVKRDQLVPLYAAVRAGFMDLAKDYTNPNVRDGGWSTVQVVLGGTTRNVNSSNARVPIMDRVSAALFALWPKK